MNCKKQQRQWIQKRFQQVEKSTLEMYSQQICLKLYDVIKQKNCRLILSYQALQEEVNLSYLHDHLQKEGIRIAFPKVESDVEMNFYESNRFVKGAYRINEPIEKRPICLQEVDLILVPVVGFDAEGHRLGHGKGYYDRFLTKLTCPKIGVAFALQQLPEVVVDCYDQTLDYIVTEKDKYNENDW